MFEYRYLVSPQYDAPTINELLKTKALTFYFNNNDRATIVAKHGTTYWVGGDQDKDWTYYCVGCSKDTIQLYENLILPGCGGYFYDNDFIEKILPYVTKIELYDVLTCHDQRIPLDVDSRFVSEIKNYNWMNIINKLGKENKLTYILRDHNDHDNGNTSDDDIIITSIESINYHWLWNLVRANSRRPINITVSSLGDIKNTSATGNLLLDLYRSCLLTLKIK